MGFFFLPRPTYLCVAFLSFSFLSFFVSVKEREEEEEEEGESWTTIRP
jgi:hypothetical protein